MRINPLVRTDGYKPSHGYMYPEKMDYMFDNIVARKGGRWGKAVFFGLQFFTKNTLMVPFTQADLDEAVPFYANYYPPMYANQVFNKDMFQYILDEYNGYMPVKIKAVPEGMVVPTGEVMATIESTDPKCASIVSFLETIMLRDIWYGTTVATNSYFMKQTIMQYAESTADNLDFLPFALHDFGARGVSSGESAIMGGSAHLVNFMGSDTLEAVYALQEGYGVAEGLPGYSIPATEHSVMSSEGEDGEMIVAQRVFDTYAKEGGVVAMVNDTYNMEAHIRNFSKIFKEKYQDTGVRWVTRPDSGNPPEMVVKALDILWEEFGGELNNKGFKVLNPSVRVIQGDGIDDEMVAEVLHNVYLAGYSTENVAFGSGGGLLQVVNRDDLRFSMKASYLEVDGVGREIFKKPITQTGDYDKSSIKGKVSLYFSRDKGYFTATEKQVRNLEVYEVLQPVYENGKLLRDLTLDEVRKNTCLW